MLFDKFAHYYQSKSNPSKAGQIGEVISIINCYMGIAQGREGGNQESQ